MGEVKWTTKQRQAIETHGADILVSAAAGSGKTAVLVERIIQMICNPKKGWISTGFWCSHSPRPPRRR